MCEGRSEGARRETEGRVKEDEVERDGSSGKEGRKMQEGRRIGEGVERGWEKEIAGRLRRRDRVSGG